MSGSSSPPPDDDEVEAEAEVAAARASDVHKILDDIIVEVISSLAEAADHPDPAVRAAAEAVVTTGDGTTPTDRGEDAHDKKHAAAAAGAPPHPLLRTRASVFARHMPTATNDGSLNGLSFAVESPNGRSFI
jgi:hypothetical protein